MNYIISGALEKEWIFQAVSHNLSDDTASVNRLTSFHSATVVQDILCGKINPAYSLVIDQLLADKLL